MKLPRLADIPRKHLLAFAVLVLLPVFVLSTVLLRGSGPPAPPAPRAPAGPATVARASVPADVAELLRDERNWRAARRLRELTTPQSDPELLVVAAKAEAGWGGWDNVRELLAGKPWLDRASGGDGWYLLGRAQEHAGQWDQAAASYGRYLRARPEAPDGVGERAVGELRHALALLRAGRVDDGVRALDHARGHVPPVQGWASLLAAEALAPRGDTARVRAFVGDGADSPAVLRAWQARVRAHLAANDPAGARRLATTFRGRAGADDARGAMAVEAAGAALRMRDTAAARTLLRETAADPANGAAVEAARVLGTLPGLTPGDRLSIARVYDRAGNADRAIAGYRAWLA
ncbi:MAG TPA: hypothetical protein VNP72_05560, partial [Longimicrobium sp.]|nr:hypothetical protein [Longimicrobium sp.]